MLIDQVDADHALIRCIQWDPHPVRVGRRGDHGGPVILALDALCHLERGELSQPLSHLQLCHVPDEDLMFIGSAYSEPEPDVLGAELQRIVSGVPDRGAQKSQIEEPLCVKI